MNENTSTVNTVAPLQNVARCSEAMERVTERQQHLPGLIAFYGPSGWGKTIAAGYVANRYRAVYVEAKSTWTKKFMLQTILIEMGVAPGNTIAEMASQAAEELAKSGRPLIIDEFDYVIEKNNVEVIRDLYESSGASILIIGEENMEHKLRKWERFHNRILAWVPAEKANLDDAKQLRHLYCGDDHVVADDLLEKVLIATQGTVRRICVNLARIQEYGRANNIESVSLAIWGDRGFYTGEAPRRRIK